MQLIKDLLKIIGVMGVLFAIFLYGIAPFIQSLDRDSVDGIAISVISIGVMVATYNIFSYFRDKK